MYGRHPCRLPYANPIPPVGEGLDPPATRYDAATRQREAQEPPLPPDIATDTELTIKRYGFFAALRMTDEWERPILYPSS